MVIEQMFVECDSCGIPEILGGLLCAPLCESIDSAQRLFIARKMRVSDTGQQIEKCLVDGVLRMLCISVQVREQGKHSSPPA
jgi:hypothetical protein